MKSILQIGVLGINVVNDTLFEEKKMRVGKKKMRVGSDNVPLSLGEPCPATVARSQGPHVGGLIDKRPMIKWSTNAHILRLPFEL